MIRLAIVGFGQRARTYFSCLENLPSAIVDPSREARALAVSKYGMKEDACFPSLDSMISSGVCLDGVIICSPDADHYSQVKQCLIQGWHILVEKPVALDYDECLELQCLARERGLMVAVCFELRAMPRFAAFREMLRERGPVRRITHYVDVGTDRMTHSFVRGIWGKSRLTAPIALTKLCHDVDFLLWAIGGFPEKWSSEGSLSTFCSANAPDRAADRCLDCDVLDCRYSAVDLYLHRRDWISGFVPESASESQEAMILRYLGESDFGRCVFRMDNDVNDHQSIRFSYADGTEVEIIMFARSRDGERRCVVEFTDGSVLDYDFTDVSGSEEPLHGGADRILLNDFVAQISNGTFMPIAPLAEAIGSHKICTGFSF